MEPFLNVSHLGLVSVLQRPQDGAQETRLHWIERETGSEEEGYDQQCSLHSRMPTLIISTHPSREVTGTAASGIKGKE